MPKVKISEFSPTPSNNTDIDGINIAEGCAPSGINDAIRELMSQLKDFQAGTAGDSFNGPIGTTTAAAGVFTTLSASGTLGVAGVATLGNGAILGTPASVTLTNATGLPIATGVSGLGTGVATALAVNVGSAGAPVLFNGALGTPSSGTVTNLTGTASININGTVGATTASTGAFTTLTTSGAVTHNAGTANGVAYLNGSKVLTTGAALTFDGTSLAVGTSSVTSGYRLEVSGAGVRNTATNPFYDLYASGQALDAKWWRVGGGGADFAITSINDAGSGADTPYRITRSAQVAQTHQWRTTGSERMRLDASGNLGLGVTPSAWENSYRAFQYGAGSAFLTGRVGTLQNRQTLLGVGASHNGTNWLYTPTGVAVSYYAQTDGSHQWFTAPSGTAGNAITFTQAMTLDASGNLIIGGTSSDSNRLHVWGNIGFPWGDNRLLWSAFDNTYRMGMRIDAASRTTQIFATTGAGDSGGAITFSTRQGAGASSTDYGTERARIDSSGRFMVGMTNFTGSLSNGPGFGVAPAGACQIVRNQNAALTLARTVSTGVVVNFAYGTTDTNASGIGDISITGSAVSYNTSSDYRLKNITGPITNSGAYIDSLNPVEGTWKVDGSTFVGLIAHEVQEASRTPVATGVKDGEEMQGMDYSSAEIIANLIAEVKSLRARLAAANI